MRIFYVTNQEEFDDAAACATADDIIAVRGSATVGALGPVATWALGSATVQAYGSATVEAHDSATVKAYGLVTVRAFGAATVRAYGAATVEARGSSTVFVESRDASAELHSPDARIIDATTGAGWIEARGVEVRDGEAILYKAVDSNLVAGEWWGRPTRYAIGSTVVAEDWNETPRCGEGLHVSPTVAQARSYRRAPSRYLRVATPADGIVPLGEDKCKVRALRVLCEVDTGGNPLSR